MATPIVISILANASQANATFSQTLSTTEKVGAGFKKMSLPAVAAIGAIGVAAKKTIDAASDLNENVSKSQTIFGAQAGAIEAFAGRASKAMGLSKTAALDATSTFGIIAQSAGLSGTATSDFSTKFTGLAGDLASFNNTTPEEAVLAIGSAMRGESEPIRKYGVMLDDATLRNRALKMGLIDNVKNALNPQQKALAASQEILAQTTKAQGDFARTSTGAANQSRILTAENENLSAKIGTGLLPVYTQLQTIVASIIGFFSQHTEGTKILAGVVAGLAVGVIAVNAAMTVGSAVTTAFSAVTTVAGGIQSAMAGQLITTRIGLAALAIQQGVVSVATKVMAAGQWLLNAALSANPIGIVIMVIAALVAAFVIAYKNSSTFRDVVNSAFSVVKNAAMGLWNGISAAFGWISGVLANAWGVARSVAGGISNAFSTVVNAAINLYNGVVTNFGHVLGFIQSIPGRVLGALGNLGSLLYNSGYNIIMGLWNGIVGPIQSMYDFIAGIANKIRSLKGPLSYDKVLLTPAGEAIIDGLIVGIKNRQVALSTTVSSITKKLANTKFTIGDVSGLALTPGGNLIGTRQGTQQGAGATYNITVSTLNATAETGRQIVSAIKEYERVGGRR